MYSLEREELVQPSYTWLWSLLGFQAGYINTFGLLACGKYVSHITGFGTQIGNALFLRDFEMAFQLLVFPLAFIFGAFFSSFFTSARIERSKRPLYSFIALLLPCVLSVLIFMGLRGVFGPFGDETILGRDFALLLGLAFVSGAQNGCFAVMTRGAIRTTHLTGLGTDFGTDLARLWFGKLEAEERRLTQMANRARLSILFAFAFGAVIAALSSHQFGYSALILPALTSLMVFFLILKVQRFLTVRHRRQTPLDARLAHH